MWEACMVEQGEQVDSEQGEQEQVACTVAQLAGALAPPAVAMGPLVESLQGRSAQHVGSAVVAEDPAQVPCHTLELARESTSRRPPTST